MVHALALLVLAALYSPVKPTKRFNGQQPNRARERRLVTQRAPSGTAVAAAHVPLFQFMPTAPLLAAQCTGAALTGTKGEAITFTRSGGQTCSKSDATVVKLTSNQPAVEANGLLLEAASTNQVLQSEAFDNASWTKSSSGGPATPVVTANQAVAPDGTSTADQVVFPAVSSAGTFSVVFQSSGATLTGTKYTHSVWMRTVSGTATVWLTATTGATSAFASTACNLTTAWARCALTWTAAGVAGSFIEIGNDLRAGSGTSPTSAATVYAWGAQSETGAFASSYIPTTTTAVTRNATNTNLPNLALSGTPSVAATVVSEGAQSASVFAMTGTGAADLFQLANVDTTGAVKCAYTGTTSGSKQHGTVLAPLTSTRLACFYDGTNIGACVGGVCQTASAAALAPVTSATTANALGYNRPAATSYAGAWLLNVCIDSTSGGCR